MSDGKFKSSTTVCFCYILGVQILLKNFNIINLVIFKVIPVFPAHTFNSSGYRGEQVICSVALFLFLCLFLYDKQQLISNFCLALIFRDPKEYLKRLYSFFVCKSKRNFPINTLMERYTSGSFLW